MKTREDLDLDCLDCIETDISNAIPWFILSSYAYNVEEDPVISDFVFEKIKKRIVENWDDINHKYKENLDVDIVKGLCYTREYPKHSERGLKHLKEIYYGKDYGRER